MSTADPCTARHHGTPTAYAKHGCRCPAACLAYSDHRAGRATGRIPPGEVPAIATVRRVRGLYGLGHDARAIAAAAGRTPQHVRVLLLGRAPTVTRATADAIADATARLARTPPAPAPTRRHRFSPEQLATIRRLRADGRTLAAIGARLGGLHHTTISRALSGPPTPATRAALTRFARERWAPLRAWDGLVFAIDDPDADDELAARTVDLPAVLRRTIRDETRAAEARAAQIAAEARAGLARARESRWTPRADESPASAAAGPTGAPAPLTRKATA